MTEPSDDLVFIEDDAIDTQEQESPLAWEILVVDDDSDVHEATRFALSGLVILGRHLKLTHVHTGREALALLAKRPDIAVVLLDVVMESDDAGLRTVEAIRNELKLYNTRIILRTGQPGRAPEHETITRYDINDYKTKSELNQSKLFTTLTAAVRSFNQLQRLDASRKGLEKIVAASNQFIAEQGLQSFAEGVITQLASLMGIEPEGLVCASAEDRPNAAEHGREYRVIAAAGQYRHLIQHQLSEIDNPHISQSLSTALRSGQSLIGHRDVTLYFRKTPQEGFAAYIESAEPIHEVDQHLLEVFCTNIALCAKNIDLVADLRRDALLDRQLGLPNRNALIGELNRLISHPPSEEGLAVALIDIDQFAAINDMLGHVFGDALLHAMTRRLRKQFTEQSFIARLAGDAFAVAAPERQLAPDALQALFSRPFLLEDHAHAVSVCIGVCRLEDGQTGVDVLKNAYIALRRAKGAGLGQSVVFSRSIGDEARQRTQLLRDLRLALTHSQLQLVFQPQVDLNGGRVIGAESLLRWQHPDGEWIPPDRFIPLAEQSGLIVPMGMWVLEESLRHLKMFHAAGFTDLCMAVNISSVQLRQPDFSQQVHEALRVAGIAPQKLELEITESVALEGLDTVTPILNGLRATGIRIAIDDFGTGYSSLNYLEQLPIDHLKIDRSFVLSVAGERGARIVRTIARLGQELSLKTIAEGVENEATGEHLRSMGYDMAQGYHYAKPMRADDFLVWLRENA
jgi:diguanylate cyclase (GGDEF)-like protein